MAIARPCTIPTIGEGFRGRHAKGKGHKCSVLLLVVCATLMWTAQPAATLQCLNQNGQPVDWFLVYKAPQLHHPDTASFRAGHAQYYADVDRPQWTLSPHPISDRGHALDFTLRQVYDAQKNNSLYLMFNDEKPDGRSSSTHGHAKGVVVFDKQSGLWLVHSAPRFPPMKEDGYHWVDSASRNGQTFLCMSFAYSSLDIISRQLLYYYPQVYDFDLPTWAVSDFPVLRQVVSHHQWLQPPYYKVRDDLDSLAGVRLTSFAKSAPFSADLYDALIAPRLGTSLLVETWVDGGAAVLPSNCTAQHKVYDVVTVQLPGGVTFNATKDHSKFAVSASLKGWVCVGGINREESQMHRAGGALCFRHPPLWETYRNTTAVWQGCPRH